MFNAHSWIVTIHLSCSIEFSIVKLSLSVYGTGRRWEMCCANTFVFCLTNRNVMRNHHKTEAIMSASVYSPDGGIPSCRLASLDHNLFVCHWAFSLILHCHRGINPSESQLSVCTLAKKPPTLYYKLWKPLNGCCIREGRSWILTRRCSRMMPTGFHCVYFWEHHFLSHQKSSPKMLSDVDITGLSVPPSCFQL